MFSDNDVVHKGLRSFWTSGGTDKSGINPKHANALRAILVHLHTATSISDIFAGLGKIKNAEKLNGGRYSLQVNGNWRVTFDFDQSTNAITKIFYEDYHSSAGAKRFD